MLIYYCEVVIMRKLINKVFFSKIMTPIPKKQSEAFIEASGWYPGFEIKNIFPYDPTNAIVFHYTNTKAYRSIQTKGLDGYYTRGFDDFTGLIPNRRFINFRNGAGLPDDG